MIITIILLKFCFAVAAVAVSGLSDGNNTVNWNTIYQCIGSESRLYDCRRSSLTSFTNCRGSTRAGVMCRGTTCAEGDIRLQGGSSSNTGRVEICHNNAWGTVCDDFWGFVNARVACLQLGFPSSCQYNIIYIVN